MLEKFVHNATLYSGTDCNAPHPENILLELFPAAVSKRGTFCRELHPENMLANDRLNAALKYGNI